MSVEELIADLQRQPNRKVPVAIVIVAKNGVEYRVNADMVRFDGRCVVIEG